MAGLFVGLSSSVRRNGTRFLEDLGFRRILWNAKQWPKQQRDAGYQRAEAARQYEKKKVFHLALPVPRTRFLMRRRLSAQSVPAILGLRSRFAANDL
jgi:hypothetical protein